MWTHCVFLCLFISVGSFSNDAKEDDLKFGRFDGELDLLGRLVVKTNEIRVANEYKNMQERYLVDMKKFLEKSDNRFSDIDGTFKDRRKLKMGFIENKFASFSAHFQIAPTDKFMK